MAKLGSSKRPAVARVQNPERAQLLIDYCKAQGWHIDVGVAPHELENVRDVKKLINKNLPFAKRAEAHRLVLVNHHDHGHDCGCGHDH